ncbi:GntR family transcriptional regulator [Proteinivorax tanatarense]|uniref:GntR family transcriptional regulator n=1 Tax=Proteinivorax tanatarense TaxID=1260629 RepID=A0AAU7VKJ3_9FIRM
MKVIISNKSEQPIYQQIKIQIKEQILADEIKENEYLPSIRQLAKDLGISVITTTRAYSDLEAEGFITTIQGKGTVVLPKDNELIREQYFKKIEEGFILAIENARLAKISEQELMVIYKNILKEWNDGGS